MSELNDVPEILNAVLGRVIDRYAECGFERLSHPEQVFLASMELLNEVNNGGFAQYMFNDFGDHGLAAVASLNEIGAKTVAAICEEFFRVLPGGKPAATRDDRQKQLDSVAGRLGSSAFDVVLDGLEKRFYAEEDDLEEKLAQYAQAHLL